jgi:hypothetical protein
MVVSGEEKAARSCQVKTKKVSAQRTNASVENVLQMGSKVESRFCSTSSRGDDLLTASVTPGVQLARAWSRLFHGTWELSG